eukprot:COSAG02_NODE_13_length_57813_cov_14.298276_11_plen_63_part_00
MVRFYLSTTDVKIIASRAACEPGANAPGRARAHECTMHGTSMHPRRVYIYTSYTAYCVFLII